MRLEEVKQKLIAAGIGINDVKYPVTLGVMPAHHSTHHASPYKEDDNSPLVIEWKANPSLGQISQANLVLTKIRMGQPDPIEDLKKRMGRLHMKNANILQINMWTFLAQQNPDIAEQLKKEIEHAER